MDNLERDPESSLWYFVGMCVVVVIMLIAVYLP